MSFPTRFVAISCELPGIIKILPIEIGSKSKSAELNNPGIL
jgi:hypothetical protein